MKGGICIEIDKNETNLLITHDLFEELYHKPNKEYILLIEKKIDELYALEPCVKYNQENQYVNIMLNNLKRFAENGHYTYRKIILKPNQLNELEIQNKKRTSSILTWEQVLYEYLDLDIHVI